MKQMIIVLLVFAILGIPALATAKGFEGRPLTNNLFVPTGYTLHKGEFSIGIGPVGFGITENVQLETNLLLWLFQFYNAGLKIALFENDLSAFSVGIGVASLNLDYSNSEGDVSFLALGPFAAFTTKIGPSTKLHLGARYSHFEADVDDVDLDDVDATSSSSGTAVNGGIEYSMSHRTKFVADGGYDFDFEGGRFGGGVIFAWTTFRLKLGVSYYSAGEGFVLPNVGLWWRFMG